MTPLTGAVHHRHAADQDDASLLILALAGCALLAISRVPSNPKHGRSEGEIRAGKNGARGQDLPVEDLSPDVTPGPLVHAEA